VQRVQEYVDYAPCGVDWRKSNYTENSMLKWRSLTFANGLSHMFVVGLTGGIGSGKTTISNIFRGQGIQVVDTDVIAREIVQANTPCLKSIHKHFGNEILLANGELDRKKLRDIIFSSQQEKSWLEALLHPLIGQQTKQQLENVNSPYAILSSPLLLESPDAELVDHILVVDTLPEQQINRTVKRDKVEEVQVIKTMLSQMSREKRLCMANDIIENSGSMANTTKQILQLHEKYLNMARQQSGN